MRLGQGHKSTKSDETLRGILAHVAHEIDAAEPLTLEKPITELEAFAEFDPLLASLQKEYLDLKQVRKTQSQQFGTDNPMADIACEAEDSAWCAMQTRYIELRKDRALMKRVQDFMRDHTQEQQAALLRDQKTKDIEKAQRLQILYRMQEISLQKQKDRDAGINAFLWVFLLWQSQKIQAFLNRSLQQDFAQKAA